MINAGVELQNKLKNCSAYTSEDDIVRAIITVLYDFTDIGEPIYKTIKYKPGEAGDMALFFKKLNSIHYDNAYGSQQLFGFIVFKDNSWLERAEYDGAEWWVYKKTPDINNLTDDPELWKDIT